MSALVYRLAVVTLFVVFLGGLIPSNEEAAVGYETTTPVAFNAAGVPTVEFNLPDMMCEDGCAWTVNDILSKQQGAKDVRVDFEAKTATVAIEEGKFDQQLAIAELVDKGFANSTLKNQEPEASAEQPASP
ncbi:MAG TPA: heavy-metal-associated domain-containing protein [Lacipirellulaceae bacterium]|nr:heavy-metal-associated domain-containing protein [Lacipirellulaceae bacterium]